MVSGIGYIHVASRIDRAPAISYIWSDYANAVRLHATAPPRGIGPGGEQLARSLPTLKTVTVSSFDPENPWLPPMYEPDPLHAAHGQGRQKR